MLLRPYSQDELSFMMTRLYCSFEGHSSLIALVVSAGVLSTLVNETADAYTEVGMPIPDAIPAMQEALAKLRDTFVPVALSGVEDGGGDESRTRTS